MELWSQIKNDDWSLVSSVGFIRTGRCACGTSRSITNISAATVRAAWATWRRATIGAALANKKYGRLTVSVQTDGDLNYSPGA